MPTDEVAEQPRARWVKFNLLHNADHPGGSDPTCYTWVRSDLLLTVAPVLVEYTSVLTRWSNLETNRFALSGETFSLH